jgi:hypothetical protein
VSIVPSTPPTLVLLPTGAGRAKTLERGPIGSYQAVAFFPDGERLLIAANEEGKPVRLYVQSLEAGGPRAVSGPGLRFAPPSDVISPDGRTAAVTDGEGRVVLFPLDGAEPRLAPGLEPGDVPMRWSLDGQALFVFRFDELPAQIRRVTFDRPGREVVARIKPADPAGVESIVAAQVTPDGRSWVYSYFQYRNDLHLVTGLK